MNLSEFIVELCKWLKYQQFEETQEIKEINDWNKIDFDSTSIPFSLQDLWVFVLLDRDHSSIFITISDFNIFKSSL